MVNTRRTDIGGNGQQRSSGPQNNVTEAEMLRYLYGWAHTTDERLKRLEDGNANAGPSRPSKGSKDHTEEVNAEAEEENSVHSKKHDESKESKERENVPDMSMVWKQLDRFHPKTFSGGSPSDAESWIDRLEMLFESINCDKYQKTIAAKTLLAGGALNWWNTVKPVDGNLLDWEEFKKIFFDYYFPIEMRHQKEAEFFMLQQGEMDENTFIDRFMELAKYVSQLDRTTEGQNNWLARQLFEKCNNYVKTRMGTYDITTLEKLITKIREVCRRHRDAEKSVRRDFHGQFSGHMGISEGINKKSYSSISGGSGNRRISHQGNFQQRSRPPMNQSRGNHTRMSQGSQRGSVASVPSVTQRPPCVRCGRVHPGECWTCFNCGEKGHLAKYCVKGKKENPTFRPTATGRVFTLTSEEAKAASNLI